MERCAAKLSARESRRQAILDVAYEVFMMHGFATTSMSAIAARMGGPKATLYNYFSTKHDLFAAVIQDDCAHKQAALFDNLIAEGDDVAAVLFEVGFRYTHLVLSDSNIELLRVVIAESVSFPELGRFMYEAGPTRGRRRIAAYVDRQISAGHVRATSAASVVDQFCEMCCGALFRQRLMNVVGAPSDADVNKNVEAAVRVILATYATDALRDIS